MAYSTPELVRLILSSVIAEEGGTAAELSDEQIQFEIDSAQAMVDTRLRNRYVTPFDTGNGPPFVITQIVTDIAAYRADLNYRKSREYDNEQMPIILRYQMACQMLDNIAKGKNTIDWPRNNDGSLVVEPPDGPFIPWYTVYEFDPRW